MIMNIKDAVINVKAWIYIVVLLIAVATTAGTYAKIPERVKGLEGKDVTHDAAISELGTAMQQYLAVQKERETWREKHEERQMIMIDELRKANGNR